MGDPSWFPGGVSFYLRLDISVANYFLQMAKLARSTTRATSTLLWTGALLPDSTVRSRGSTQCSSPAWLPTVPRGIFSAAGSSTGRRGPSTSGGFHIYLFRWVGSILFSNWVLYWLFAVRLLEKTFQPSTLSKLHFKHGWILIPFSPELTLWRSVVALTPFMF